MQSQGDRKKEDVVRLLRRSGLSDLADAASRDLPERINADELDDWCFKHGLTRSELMSMFGASP